MLNDRRKEIYKERSSVVLYNGSKKLYTGTPPSEIMQPNLLLSLAPEFESDFSLAWLSELHTAD